MVYGIPWFPMAPLVLPLSDISEDSYINNRDGYLLSSRSFIFYFSVYKNNQGGF